MCLDFSCYRGIPSIIVLSVLLMWNQWILETVKSQSVIQEKSLVIWNFNDSENIVTPVQCLSFVFSFSWRFLFLSPSGSLPDTFHPQKLAISPANRTGERAIIRKSVIEINDRDDLPNQMSLSTPVSTAQRTPDCRVTPYAIVPLYRSQIARRAKQSPYYRRRPLRQKSGPGSASL